MTTPRLRHQLCQSKHDSGVDCPYRQRVLQSNQATELVTHDSQLFCVQPSSTCSRAGWSSCSTSPSGTCRFMSSILDIMPRSVVHTITFERHGVHPQAAAERAVAVASVSTGSAPRRRWRCAWGTTRTRWTWTWQRSSSFWWRWTTRPSEWSWRNGAMQAVAQGGGPQVQFMQCRCL